MSQAPCNWLYTRTHTHIHACAHIHTCIRITTLLVLFHLYACNNTDEVNAVTALYPWQWRGSCALWGSCKTEGLIRGGKAQLQWAPPFTGQGSCTFHVCSADAAKRRFTREANTRCAGRNWWHIRDWGGKLNPEFLVSKRDQANHGPNVVLAAALEWQDALAQHAQPHLSFPAHQAPATSGQLWGTQVGKKKNEKILN